jgi:hypothetical protein
VFFVILKFDGNVAELVGDQFFEFGESFFEYFNFGLIVSGDCGSFFPFDMESVLESDFFAPTNVNQDADDGNDDYNETYDDDKFPAVDLMALFETFDPLAIDFLAGVVVFEGPYFAGACGVAALRESCFEIGKGGGDEEGDEYERVRDGR